MKSLIVYECQYCKKLFRSKNRHSCKFDPNNRNCYTCKHNKEIYAEILTDYGYDGREYDRKNLTVNCAKDHNVDCYGLSLKKQKLDCDDYEYGGKFYENEHHTSDERIGGGIDW